MFWRVTKRISIFLFPNNFEIKFIFFLSFFLFFFFFFVGGGFFFILFYLFIYLFIYLFFFFCYFQFLTKDIGIVVWVICFYWLFLGVYFYFIFFFFFFRRGQGPDPSPTHIRHFNLQNYNIFRSNFLRLVFVVTNRCVCRNPTCKSIQREIL